MRLHHIVPLSLGMLLLAGRAEAAPLSPNPALLTFNQQGVGSCAADQTVAWTNNSGVLQNLNSMSIVGANPGDFNITANDLPPPVAIGNGVKFNVSVNFCPTLGGMRAAKLEATMKDGTTIDVNLSGTGLGPKLTVTPNPIAAGGSKLNVKNTIGGINVSNTGGGTVTVTAITIVGPNAAEFAVTVAPALPFNFGPAGANAQNISISYTPTFAGTHNATLRIANNDPMAGPNLDVPIQGKAGDPKIAPDITTLAFGNQRVGVPQAMPQVVNLVNAGNSDLVITSIDKDNGPMNNGVKGDFVLDLSKLKGFPGTPLTIPTGGSAPIGVSFAPTALGDRKARVVIASNDPVNPTSYINLIGTGTNSILACAPNSLDFGMQQIYQGSKKQTITVSNTGTDTANILSIMPGGAKGASFRYNGLQMPPIKVPPMGSAAIDIIALPLELMALSGNITITTDDPKTPSCVIPVGVTGIGGSCKVDPTFGDYGSVPINSMTPKTFTISNTGTGPCEVDTVNLLDMNNVFNITLMPELQNLPLVLNPGQMTTFSVTCAPMAATPYTGEVDLDFKGDPQNSHIHVPLDCSGSQAGFTVSPNTIMFTTTLVGAVAQPQNITIANSGTASLNVKTITLGGTNPNQFSVVLPDVPFMLAGGAMRVVPVSYQPTSGGNHSATVVVNADGFMPAQVKLAGVAVSPQLLISPSGTVAFPNDQYVGVTTGVTVDSAGNPAGVGGNFPLTIGLKVPGSSTIPFTTITAISSSNPEFTVDLGKTNTSLKPGDQTSFDVLFTPSQTGARSGVINISVRGLNGPIQTLNVKGTGTQSHVDVVKKGGTSGCSVGAAAPAGGSALWLLALPGVALLLRRRRPQQDLRN